MHNRVKILMKDNFLYNLSTDIWIALILPSNIMSLNGDKIFAITFLLIFQMKFIRGEASTNVPIYCK